MNADFRRDVHALLGLPFDRIGRAAAAARLREASRDGTPVFLSTPNVNFAMGCRDDDAFRQSIWGSDLCIADGMPLVWVARLLGIPIDARVAGSDVFETLRDQPEGAPLDVFFFGGPDGAAGRACDRLNAHPSGLRCVGFDSPGFVDLESMSDEARIARINASGAGFLVVALGAKKGQAWIERNRSRLVVPVVSHLGAVLNMVAGTVRRAPRWMQRAGLEWCWRIAEEPSLCKRYAADALALARAAATQVLPGLALRILRWLMPAGPGRNAVEVEFDLDRVTLVPKGAWGDDALSPLRDAFSAIDPGLAVRIDLRNATDLGSGFIGLCMLLAEQQRRSGGALDIVNVNSRVRLAFRASGALTLLERHASNTAVTIAGQNPGSSSAPLGFGAGQGRSGKTMVSIRSATVLTVLMIAISIGSVLARPDKRAADAGPAVDLESLVPKRFGDWQAMDQATQIVNPQTRELIDRLYSQVLSRTYVSPKGDRIMLSLAYGADQRGEMQAHKPEVCYPAQGFKLHSNLPGAMRTPYGELPVRRLTTSLGQRHEPVTYWFTFGDTAIGGAMYKRLVEVRFGLTGQIPDGLLFRVSSIDRDADAAFAVHERFVNELLAAMPSANRRRLSGLDAS